MNKKQKEFLMDYCTTMFAGFFLVLVSGVIIYFGKKLYGTDGILLAGMGALFCLGMSNIVKALIDSFRK